MWEYHLLQQANQSLKIQRSTNHGDPSALITQRIVERRFRGKQTKNLDAGQKYCNFKNFSYSHQNGLRSNEWASHNQPQIHRYPILVNIHELTHFSYGILSSDHWEWIEASDGLGNNEGFDIVSDYVGASNEIVECSSVVWRLRK